MSPKQFITFALLFIGMVIGGGIYSEQLQFQYYKECLDAGGTYSNGTFAERTCELP